MKKQEIKKLSLKRSSIADLSKSAHIKGGNNSIACPSALLPCDPPDPTRILNTGCFCPPPTAREDCNTFRATCIC